MSTPQESTSEYGPFEELLREHGVDPDTERGAEILFTIIAVQFITDPDVPRDPRIDVLQAFLKYSKCQALQKMSTLLEEGTAKFPSVPLKFKLSTISEFQARESLKAFDQIQNIIETFWKPKP